MFDTFRGLPLHVLVIHFVVVLVPMGATATIAVMVRPAWRAQFARYVAAGNVALLGLTFVTVRAGLAFKKRLDPTGEGGLPGYDHQTYGEILLWIMLALATVSVITWLAARADQFHPAALSGLVAIVVLLAVAAIGMTMVTGETGAKRWSFLVSQN